MGLPIFVVGAGIAEFRCVGTSPRSIERTAVGSDEEPEDARPLMERVRSHLAPLTTPFN